MHISSFRKFSCGRRMLFLCSIFLLLLHSSLLSQGKAAKGIFISIGVNSQGILTGFDGISFYGASSDIVLVPKLTSGQGFSLSGGYRWENTSAEFSINHSWHDWTHDIDKNGGVATITVFSGVVKRFFNLQKNIQPYIQASLDLPLMVIPRNATTYTEYETSAFPPWEVTEHIKKGNPIFWDIGIGVGAGLSIQATRNFAFHIDSLLHCGLFLTLSASTMGSQDVVPQFIMAYTLQCGISYTFER